MAGIPADQVGPPRISYQPAKFDVHCPEAQSLTSMETVASLSNQLGQPRVWKHIRVQDQGEADSREGIDRPCLQVMSEISLGCKLYM